MSIISSVRLKFIDRRRSARGENNSLIKTDAKGLKHGEQTGLETPVVHALTDESEMSKYFFGVKVNALNFPPEEYDCKIETQRD